MNCQQCQEDLIGYVHEELEAPVRDSISLHLAQCSDCALEFCRLRADVEGIVRAYEEAPSSKTSQDLRRRVQERFAPAWWQRLGRAIRQPVPIYAVAAAAAVPFLVWFAAETADERPAATQRPAAIDQYDATSPLHDPRIL